ncbi:MAG: ATP-binding protein [Nitrospinota bacterium]|nr:ATP-binding protein [Nitrospinota bacterium]
MNDKFSDELGSVSSLISKPENSPILQSIFDGLPDGIIVIDKFFKVVMANKAMQTLLDKPSNELEGKYCFYICHDTNRVCGDCQAENVFMNMHPPARIRKCSKDNNENRQYEILNFPIRNMNGEVHYMIEYIRDITNLQNIEKELMETRRLSIIGEMAAKTSHEIRNPLNAMEGAAHYLLEEYKDDQKIQKFVGLIREQILRLNDVTTNLLMKAKQKYKGEKDQISTVLVKSIEIAQYAPNGKEVEIELFLDETLPAVYFDPSAMQEVFVNILKNAMDAVQENGRIEVVGQMRQRRGEDFVEISVIDNGEGIPFHKKDQVFDTFFTTKANGTGLGLVIVKDIMKAHGGYIFIDSEPGGGTCVVLGLPAQ